MLKTKNPKWVPQLLSWYDIHKRDLPWRDCGDPYKIWVSEVMSQQTRIEAMKPYYDNWMRLFPTLHDLAEATEEEVVHAWQGLGYYSRARNLRLGVREVVERYGGIVPRDRTAMESLKGVGSYTAGAVLSMAYNEPEAAVDGNVLRIYARLYRIDEDILSTKGRKTITALVEETLPQNRPGDFNQALMDFGSAVCIPKTPRCGDCPLTNLCEAYQSGVTDTLPVRIKKTKVVDVPVFVGILQFDGYYLLHRRPDRGLLRSMWEFPSLENASSYDEGERKLSDMVRELGFDLMLRPVAVKELTHVFSHRRWFMTAYRGDLQYIGDGFSEAVTNAADINDEKMSGNGLNPVAAGGIPDMEIVRKHLGKDWILIRRSEFSDYAWAGPHGKLTEYCPSL